MATNPGFSFIQLVVFTSLVVANLSGPASLASVPTCRQILSPKAYVHGEVQLERFKLPIERIRGVIRRSTSVDDFIDIAIREDLRGSFFAIQNLFRVYDKIGTGKKMMEWSEKAHDLQRQIGYYTDQIEYVKIVEKAGAPAPVIAVKKMDLDKQKQLLADMLVEDGWYTKSPQNSKVSKVLKNMEEYLESRKWRSEEQDAIDVLEVMIDKLKEIEDLDFDPADLESQDGIHRFRRALRANPAIISLAMNGLFQLDKSPSDYRLSEYINLRTQPIANEFFSQLPSNPRLKNFVIIPQHYYLAISKLINDFGTVKKIGQITEMLADAYYRSGIPELHSHKAAWRQAELTVQNYFGPSFVEYSEAATQLRKELKRTQILKRYRRVLEKAQKQLAKNIES